MKDSNEIIFLKLDIFRQTKSQQITIYSYIEFIK